MLATMKNTVQCPLCLKDVPVKDKETRTEALLRHLRELHHGQQS